jgi:hypothetical protein
MARIASKHPKIGYFIQSHGPGDRVEFEEVYVYGPHAQIKHEIDESSSFAKLTKDIIAKMIGRRVRLRRLLAWRRRPWWDRLITRLLGGGP